MEKYKFFQHQSCEYFPCHKTARAENFNCLFCFCPLYLLGENCGGNFAILPCGTKDCTNCTIPHENYDYIIAKLKENNK